MIKFSILHTLMVLMLCHVPANGQDTAGVINLHKSVEISYDFNRTSRNSNSNEILKELATDAVKGLRSTRLKLDFDLKFEMDSDINRGCKMKMIFLNPAFTGDFFFRGFDVSDVLLPDFGAFEFRVFKKSDISGYHEFKGDNYPVNWADSVSHDFDFPCTDIHKDSLQLTSIAFFYDEDALNRFHERLTLVHDYYASSAIVDSLLVLAYSMDLKKEEHYPEYFVFILEINKALEIIGKKHIQETLPLSKYDPKEFKRKFNEIYKLSKSITMTFNERLENADSIQPVASTDSVIALFISGMIRYINWTMLVNERNGTIYHEYLDNFYSLNAFGDDIFVLKKLLRKISPQVDEDTLISRVFHTVFVAYHEKSNALMKESHYAEAIELLDHARRFSEYSPFSQPENQDDTTRLMAITGIYNSYLGVAESSIRYRKFEMAETYLAKALAYRQANFSSQLPDSIYKSVFLELVREQIAECDLLATNQDFQGSLDCLRYFEASNDSSSIAMILPDLKLRKETAYAGLVDEMLVNAERYKLSGNPDSALILYDLANRYIENTSCRSCYKNRMDSLAPGFDKIRYEQLLTKVQDNFQRKEYSGAYSGITKAKTILDKNGFAIVTSFDSLWKLVYPRYLQYLLMISEKYIWTNKLDDAGSFVDSIFWLQSSMGFGTDTCLSIATEKYRSRIKEKQCLNAKEAMEIYEIRASHYIEQSNFLQMKVLLDSALKADEKAKNCQLSVLSIRDTLQKYSDAIYFQRSLADIVNQVSVDQYREALLHYTETESFFHQHRVNRSGIDCKPLYEYVKEKSDLRFTYASIELFKERMELLKTLEFLKLYRLQGGEARVVKETQQIIGKEMANTDFPKMNEKNPLELLEGYSHHDIWMSSFERAYTLQWNLLKKTK